MDFFQIDITPEPEEIGNSNNTFWKANRMKFHIKESESPYFVNKNSYNRLKKKEKKITRSQVHFLSKNISKEKKSGGKLFFESNFWIEHTSNLCKMCCERKVNQNIYFFVKFFFVI